MKTVKHSARRRSGLTLVELIVVLGIIALALGVAVPGIVSLASLGRADFGNSARNLLGAMRAAKMYSSTYRTITAVAYVYNEAYDSVLLDASAQPLPQPVLEGFALVRQAVDRQDALNMARAWAVSPDYDGGQTLDSIADYFVEPANNIFFTLQNEEGAFREFGRDAVVLSMITENIDMADSVNLPANLRDILGLSIVRVIDPGSWVDNDNNDLPDPVFVAVPLTSDPTQFPAHVYSPSGPMRIGGAAPERITIEVGPSPELADAYRFGRELSTAEQSSFLADESGEDLGQAEIITLRRFLEPIRIEMYQSTGRVNMASEGM